MTQFSVAQKNNHLSKTSTLSHDLLAEEPASLCFQQHCCKGWNLRHRDRIKLKAVMPLPQTTFILLLTPDVIFQLNTLLRYSGAHSGPSYRTSATWHSLLRPTEHCSDKLGDFYPVTEKHSSKNSFMLKPRTHVKEQYKRLEEIII